MKKLIASMLVLAMSIGLLAGCGSSGDTGSEGAVTLTVSSVDPQCTTSHFGLQRKRVC